MTGWVSIPEMPGLAVRFRDDSGRKVVCAIRLEASDRVRAEEIRRIPLARIEADANPAILSEELPPLDRSGKDGEAFSRLVARHYAAYRRISAKPVAAMASVAGVPLPTAHGWVREARLRGLIPPSTRRGTTD